MFIDQLRELSQSHRTTLVKTEEKTDWVSVLSITACLHYSVLVLMLVTFWLVTVSASLQLTFLGSSVGIFLITNYLGWLVCSSINDRS